MILCSDLRSRAAPPPCPRVARVSASLRRVASWGGTPYELASESEEPIAKQGQD